MLNKRAGILFFILGMLIPNIHAQVSTAENYIRKYLDIAVKEKKEYGIPVSITLAQGMLESAYGNSRLARDANNHFGIKCHKEWAGEKIFHDDDAKDECFRKYNNVEESFKDHSIFLSGRDRYNSLFELDITDYKGWAIGLKDAGYATNPRYGDILIKIIERYNLHQYDTLETQQEVLAKKQKEINFPSEDDNISEGEDFEPIFWNQSGRNIFRNNRVKCTVAKKGDNLGEVASDLETTPKQLRRYNELTRKDTLEPGNFVYLQPKRRRASKEYHIVEEGETMHEISQFYGIKLKHLYKKNLMAQGTEPVVGQKLWLKKKKKDPNKKEFLHGLF